MSGGGGGGLTFKKPLPQKGEARLEILTIEIAGASGGGWGHSGFSPFACEAQPPTAVQNRPSRSPAETYSTRVQTTITAHDLHLLDVQLDENILYLLN